MPGALRPAFSRWRTVSVNLVVESKPGGSSPKKKKFWKMVLIPVGVFIAPRSNLRVPVGGPGAPHELSGCVCCAVRSSCASIATRAASFLSVSCAARTVGDAAHTHERRAASPADASARAQWSRPRTLHPLLAPRAPVARHRDPPWELASRWNRCRICPGSHGFSSDVRDGHCACGGMAGSALLAPVTASARGGKPRCSWVCQPGVGIGVSAPRLGPRPGGRRRGPPPQAVGESFGETVSNLEVQPPSAGT